VGENVAKSSVDAERTSKLAKDTTEMAQNQLKWIGTIVTIAGLIFALFSFFLKRDIDQIGNQDS